MQKNKLREFIIYSVAFHLILIGAILFYFFKNPLSGGKTGTVMVGVVSTEGMKGSEQATTSITTENQSNNAGENSKPNLALEKEPVKKTFPDKTNTGKKKQTSRQTTSNNETKATNRTNQTSSSELRSETNPDIGIESASLSNSGKPNAGQVQASGVAGINTELAYPDYRLNPKPKYPRTARKRGYEGEVRLKVLVLENGEVGKIEIIRHSGYEILDDSAIEAVKNWVFVPGKENGKGISSWVTVPITFQLKKG